jgi:hypothetical protein
MMSTIKKWVSKLGIKKKPRKKKKHVTYKEVYEEDVKETLKRKPTFRQWSLKDFEM